ncbi:MAG: YybH family protein [Gemmatimonadota bacterium]
MRSLMPTLCAALLAVPSAALGQADDAKSAISELAPVFAAAWNDGDAAAIAAQYADGAVILPPGSEPVQGAEAIVAFFTKELESGLRLELTTKEVHDFGDRALEVGSFVFTYADGGHADHGKYMALWKKVDGSWKIYRDTWNSSMTP